MTIIYSYYTGSDDEAQHFATKAEAIKDAQEAADYHEIDVEIEQHIIADLPARELAIALLSREGWCADSKVIKTVKPRFHLRLQKRDAA